MFDKRKSDSDLSFFWADVGLSGTVLDWGGLGGARPLIQILDSVVQSVFCHTQSLRHLSLFWAAVLADVCCLSYTS